MLQLFPIANPSDVIATPCGETVVTEGMALIVHARHYGAGSAVPTEVILSADGLAYLDGWHEGPEAEAVYVERWSREGREFHGWVDSVSRRLVQAG